jgi:mono/diheme cytochrome c family protein
MPSFAGRLSDRQVADLANYVRTSWGNQAPANVTAKMAGVWRSTTSVPDYGTEAAERFDCPQVGGGPGAAGPDAGAVAAVAAMMQGGDRDIGQLAAAYQAQASDDDPAQVVDALVAAYCPTVAASAGPAYLKTARLDHFALQAAATLSPQTATVPFPKADLTLALPVGHTLVAREPDGSAKPLACPADDGAIVPQALVASAREVVGTPTLPATADARRDFVSSLQAEAPKGRPADIANALIVTYCGAVAADGAADQALRRTWLETFSQEVIQDLQTASARPG